jgi:methionine synthase II (cobalamin-independent)
MTGARDAIAAPSAPAECMCATGGLTGIGSMGGGDASAAFVAILSAGCDLPFWPQLPESGPGADMVTEAAGALGFVRATGALPRWRLVPESHEEPFERFWATARRSGTDAGFETILAAMPGFAALRSAAQRQPMAHVKGQWIGPVSLAASLSLESGGTLLDEPQAWKPLLDAMFVQLRAQARRLLAIAPRVDLWIDEPCLPEAAAHSRFDRDSLRAWYAELAAACGPCVRLGVHCCAPPPWTSLWELAPALVSIDVWSFATRLEEEIPALRHQLERGAIAWGIVPASGECSQTEAILDRLEPVWQAVAPGGARATLGSKSLLTPACGLATLEPAAACERLQRVGECGERLRARA